MAWQNSGPMMGNGAPGGNPDAGGNGNQPQGTEYTLQGIHASTCERHFVAYNFTGVMRFLQTEWHRHERDRNAWQIERAEMRSRIGKLEGDSRTSKRLQESLGKHVKILENALKKEREKVKSLQADPKGEITSDEAEAPKEPSKLDMKSGKFCPSLGVLLMHL